MATITLTPANLSLVSGDTQNKLAYEAIAQGETVYTVSGGNSVGVADSNASGKNTTVLGVALTGAAAAGQPVVVAGTGCIIADSGAPFVAGRLYVQSLTAGKMADATLGDAAQTGSTVSLVGFAQSTTNFKINVVNTTIAYG